MSIQADLISGSRALSRTRKGRDWAVDEDAGKQKAWLVCANQPPRRSARGKEVATRFASLWRTGDVGGNRWLLGRQNRFSHCSVQDGGETKIEKSEAIWWRAGERR